MAKTASAGALSAIAMADFSSAEAFSQSTMRAGLSLRSPAACSRVVASSAAAFSAVPRHRLIDLAETEGSMEEEE